MSKECFRGAVEWALMVALVLGVGAMAQAQNQNQDQPQRPVIRIGKSDDADQSAPRPGEDQVQQQAPKHWIGLLFGDIGPEHPLRAQLDIPEGEGLLVEQVMPNSPAEKAGIKRHDILLRANDTNLRDKRELVDLVRTAGEKGGQLSIELLRQGKRQTVSVKPEERPADAFPPQSPQAPPAGEFGGPGGLNPEDLLREFGAPQPPNGFQFRQFGPGMILGGPGGGIANMPNGVAISISKEGDKPAHITVKRGGETWEVSGDDPESLKKLPDDLRPFVEQMLHGGSPLRKFALPNGPGQPSMQDFGDGRMRERMERMEKELEQLRQRVLGPEQRPADKPQTK